MQKGRKYNMSRKDTFYKNVWKIAVPVTLQSMLQSSFSVIDQIMIGQLGSVPVAGIGLAGKFSSLYSVLVAAVAAVAGIMIAQYIGKRDKWQVCRSFRMNLVVAMVTATLFAMVCIAFPLQIMRIYTTDHAVNVVAADYLQVIAFSYIPMAVGMLFSTLLRCREAASLPLYATMISAFVNTGLNYVLIFGRFGAPKMGAAGAAWATTISQWLFGLVTIVLFYWHNQKQKEKIRLFLKERSDAGEEAVQGLTADLGEKTVPERTGAFRQYIGMLCPILICEFLWSLGENVYAVIYGHIGTDACAAMTLTVPIQTLFIGALKGLAEAAGILIGKALGGREYDRAWKESNKLMCYGWVGALVLSAVLFLGSGLYVQIYQVEENVRDMARILLYVFAIVAPVKVQNMILGGGILRSGGKTQYVMWIDMIGTWCFGVPLGLCAAFWWNLPIPAVYFILSMEECVRLAISFVVFRRGRWMESL
ncbi:MAG: MATE family efflux transporter [Clostridiales bacterium]|nr:MATE family efflux transporter [Clostridiales bacterium]